MKTICFKQVAAIIIIMVLSFKVAHALSWPVWPDSTNHRIGNAFGTLASGGYFHPGTDILAPAGTPVYAAKSGYVKVLKRYLDSDLQWRLVIGDSAGTQECDAWRYDHMDHTTIPHSVGDTITEGQFLGNIATWSSHEFHHLHCTPIRCQGDSTAWADNMQWRYMTNALDLLEPHTDPDPPVFESAYGSQIFAFAVNNTDSYFEESAILSGDVDIVCRVYDLINDDYWRVTPYKVEFQISGDSITPWINGVCFTGELFNLSDGTSYATYIIYQDDSTCNSQGSYETRDFYFNVTNTDGDSVVEFGDEDNCWQTSYFHNGQFTISIRASDNFGNVTTESMQVTVENYFELSGTILLGEKNGRSQTTVTVVSSGQSDTTDSEGIFSIPNVGGGSQLVEIRHGGYEPVDTILMMNQNQQLDLTLNFLYLCGDSNGDGTVNILDITFLIAYLYSGGPDPVSEWAADPNGDGTINILDISYLIAYLYQEGPEPVCL